VQILKYTSKSLERDIFPAQSILHKTKEKPGRGLRDDHNEDNLNKIDLSEMLELRKAIEETY
jgi:hypothetical protein